MRLWPFGKRPPVETRQQPAGFTDAVVQALVNQAAGGAVRDASATAALEAAAGAYARAFAVAEVSPSTAATRALTPAILALLARDLIRRGEAVHVIEVDRTGMVKLRPAGSWDVRGGDDEATWTYRCDVFGPSGNRTRLLPGAAVIHARYAVDPARPWFGISPLGWAALTGALHGHVEDALKDEASGTRGHVLPMPQGPKAAPGQVDENGEPIPDPNQQLRADIAALKGRTAMVESTAQGWGEGQAAAPKNDWVPQRLGAAPPAPLVDLRSESGRAVLAATGCPPGLWETGGDAAGRRESWRQFLHGAVSPVAALLAAELAVKLEVPDLRIGFDRLFASDLSGRARAFQSLVKAGMAPDKAAALAGLMEGE